MVARYRSSFWMPDGNIILSCSQVDTDSRILFRVHRCILMRHSTFFDDLFSTPYDLTADAEGETYEGIPVIHMYDMADDVEALLLAVYKPATCTVPKQRWEKETPLELRGNWRLADKYGFEKFSNRIKNHIIRRRPENAI